MGDGTSNKIYQAFGRLVRQHRKKRDGLTQEQLGQLVGLSRTSITNIEKGRQHVSLHQFYAIAEALRVRPDVLLPPIASIGGESSVANKLPPNTEPEIAAWASKVAGD